MFRFAHGYDFVSSGSPGDAKDVHAEHAEL